MSESKTAYETKLNEDGSLTIPSDVLKKVGIVPNSRVVVLYDGEKIIIQSAIPYYLEKFQEAVLEETGQLKFKEGMIYFQHYLPMFHSVDASLLKEFRAIIKD